MEYVTAYIGPQKRAQPHSKTKCAVALSIKDSDDAIEYVRVDHDEIRISFKDNDHRFRFKTPRRVQAAIRVNDQHLNADNTFTLRLTDDDLVTQPVRRSHATEGQKVTLKKAYKQRKADGLQVTGVRPGRPHSYRQ